MWRNGGMKFVAGVSQKKSLQSTWELNPLQPPQLRSSSRKEFLNHGKRKLTNKQKGEKWEKIN